MVNVQNKEKVLLRFKRVCDRGNEEVEKGGGKPPVTSNTKDSTLKLKDRLRHEKIRNKK